MQQSKLYENNVVYQIYPRSFCDSNNDGIGDIPGIISKLDYLHDLGIGIIWLSPCYKSPKDDIGYDIADYCDIDPDYGTMEDMERLISEANKRGIKIVMDLVVNHTSDEHPWFIESKKEGSKYRDYYYWRKGRNNNKKAPNNWQSNFTGSAWKYDKDVGLWYLHLYSDKQVDLNWHNPEVIKEVKVILKFWLDKGIYGFRCDVINQIYKTSLKNGSPRFYLQGKEHYFSQPGNHVILKELYNDVFSQYDSMTVGECFGVTLEDAKKFVDHELDMVFQFEHMNVDKSFLPIFWKKYKPAAFKKILVKWQQGIDWNANYLENHDQHRSIERFGDVKNYYKESAKMLATMIMTLRGTPYIFEGEEIGMINNHYDSLDEINDVSAHRVGKLIKKVFPLATHKQFMKMVDVNNRDNSRTPMQWNSSVNGGFSTVKPWVKVSDNYDRINVEDTLKDVDYDTVINCAAVVKHFSNDDLLDRVNFHGVENLVEICCKHNKKLVQISTGSVAGESVDNAIPQSFLMCENQHSFGQNLDNKYVRTKWQAEKAILEAIQNRGLRGKIIRVGNLMSRASDGEFQANFKTNNFMNTLRAYKTIGYFPMTNIVVPNEFSPIDSTAEAVVTLAGTPDKFTVFHANNNHLVDMANVIDAMNACGLNIKIVKQSEFQQHFDEIMHDEKRNASISSLVAYLGNDNSRRFIATNNTFTLAVLNVLGFRWPIITEEYIEKAIKALKSMDFFD